MTDQLSIRRPATLSEIFRVFLSHSRQCFKLDQQHFPPRPFQFSPLSSSRHSGAIIALSSLQFLWFCLIASALFCISSSSMQFIAPTSKPHLSCFYLGFSAPTFRCITQELAWEVHCASLFVCLVWKCQLHLINSATEHFLACLCSFLYTWTIQPILIRWEIMDQVNSFKYRVYSPFVQKTNTEMQGNVQQQK